MRHPGLHRLQHRLGIDADFVLRMRIRPQRQKMQQIVQIRLPVPLGIGVQRQIHPRQFARQARAGGIQRLPGLILIQHFQIMIIGLRRIIAQQPQHPLGLRPFQHRTPALPIIAALRRQLVRLRHIKFPVQHRIPRRIFIHIRRAMPNPLPRNKNWQFNVILDLAHLKRRRMPVPHQIADQPAILIRRLGAPAVTHPGGLHHRRIIAHVIHHADETMVEHWHRLGQHGLQRRHHRPGRGHAVGSGLSHFGNLFGG